MMVRFLHRCLVLIDLFLGEELVAEEEDDEPSMKRIKTEDSMPSDCIEAETITMAMEPHMITKEELVEEQVVLAEDLHTHLEAHEELVQEEQYIEEEEVVSWSQPLLTRALLIAASCGSSTGFQEMMCF